jgi:hypothetical protein
MTYCCNHARRANELMDSAINWISGTSNYEMEPMVGLIMPVGGGTAAGFANKKACDEYKEWMSNARSKLYEAKQELSQCKCIEMSTSLVIPTNFSLTVKSSSSSTTETAVFVSAAMSEVAAKRGGNAVATIQTDNTVSVKYTPPTSWWNR